MSMRRRPPLLLWQVAGLSLWLSVACGGGPEIENVLLISIDTLRADRLGSYGYERDTSPALDRLAAEGVRFAHTISQSPWTTPSHMALMTSLQPSSHTVNQDYVQFLNDRAGKRRYRILPDGVDTLAGLLKAQGFRTIALTGGITISGDLGFERGFDTYLEDARKLKPENWAQLVGWLSEPDLRPFFLFFHTFEVHAPYLRIGDARPLMTDEQAEALQAFINANPEMRERDLKKYLEEQELFRVEITSRLYDGGVRSVDQFLGRLFDELRRRGLWDRTLIVVTSDHGEEFADQRHFAIYNVHCDGTYDHFLRVPLIFRIPGRFAEGRVVEEQVRLIDVAPTILDLLGIPIPDQMQGTSLVGWMEGREHTPRLEAFSEAMCIGPEWKSLRSADYKYMASFPVTDAERTGIPGQAESEKLFDLRNDPGEKSDLAAAQPDLLRRMRSRLFRYYLEEALPVAGEERSLEINPELEKELRALGYLD